MSEGKTLQIGDTEVVIRRFRAFKAFVAGDLMAEVGDEVDKLVEDYSTYVREYGEKHKVTLDKTSAVAMGIPEEEFGSSGTITLPAKPGDEEVFFKLFPQGFKIARNQIIQLIGLVIIPNDDLKQAEADDDGDAVSQALDKRGKDLLFEGDIGDVLKLLLATVEEVKDQLTGLDDVLGKLRDLVQPKRQVEDEKEPEGIQSSAEIEQAEPTDGDEIPQESLTSSQATTDGLDRRSSSELRGAIS